MSGLTGDGDSAGKAMDAGASSATKDTEFTTGIHEDSKPRMEPLGEKTTGASSMFDTKGAIGKQFTTEGIVGGTAQKIGGPLDEQGMIGKHFTDKGTIGGMVQQNLGKGESNSLNK